MAVLYYDLGSALLNVEYQLEGIPLLSAVVALIEVYRLANSGFMDIQLTDGELNGQLKRLTGCVVATGTDLNCYPTGLNTAILFDSDGNLVP